MSGSASSAIRIARARPIDAATVAVAPPSGIRPTRAKASSSEADSAHTARSQASTADSPTPAATPLTPATTGVSQRRIDRTSRLAASRAPTSNRSWASSPAMSAPVLNAGPVPVSTTTRTSSRAPARSSSSAAPCVISSVRALYDSGRSNRIVSTPSSSATASPGIVMRANLVRDQLPKKSFDSRASRDAYSPRHIGGLM